MRDKTEDLKDIFDDKSDIFSSFGELDDIEVDDGLYNELVPSSTYNLEDTMRIEKSVFMDKEDSFDSYNDAFICQVNDELCDNTVDSSLENTMEIDTFELENEMSELLEPSSTLVKKKKWWNLPITVAEDHHLENAFVSCAILGFITASMGTGFLTYILNHI